MIQYICPQCWLQGYYVFPLRECKKIPVVEILENSVKSQIEGKVATSKEKKKDLPLHVVMQLQRTSQNKSLMPLLKD